MTNNESEIQQCTFEIVAAELDPDQVSVLFGMKPDRAARRGDKSRGQARHVQGLWVINSTSRVSSIVTGPNEHLACITNFAIEHEREIKELRKVIEVKIGIRLLWEFDDSTLIFLLEQERMGRLANIVDWVGFSIT